MSKCEHRMKCDFYGCKNMAKYSFSVDKNADLRFCESCLKGMMALFSDKANKEVKHKNCKNIKSD